MGTAIRALAFLVLDVVLAVLARFWFG